jgi:hypothetical protein
MVLFETRNVQNQLLRSLPLAWTRPGLILTVAVAYLLGFAPLYGAWGAGVAAPSALPVVVAGFFLGLGFGGGEVGQSDAVWALLCHEVCF